MSSPKTNWVGTEIAGQMTPQRYRVTNPLSEGGMATVYMAQSSNGAEVVVKTPLPALLEDPHFLARFEREMRTMARIRHPHIVPLLDCGLHQNRPFVVVPYYGGGTLASKQKGPDSAAIAMSVESTLHWLDPIAAAVDYLHQRDLYHRDIKPENIFFDAALAPVLADFGIVKVATDNPSEQATVFTQPGMVLGTPAYMAPEQIMGQRLDRKIDIYALGVMAYEWLTGKVPYEGTNPALVLAKQLSLSRTRVNPAELRSQVSREIGDAIAKAMAFNPTERFETAAEFAAAYRKAWLATAPAPRPKSPSQAEVQLPPPSPPVAQPVVVAPVAAAPAPIPKAEPTPVAPRPKAAKAIVVDEAPWEMPTFAQSLRWALVASHFLMAGMVYWNGLERMDPNPKEVAIGEAWIVSPAESSTNANPVSPGFDLVDGLIALGLWPALFLLAGSLVFIRHFAARPLSGILPLIVGLSALTKLSSGIILTRPLFLGGWLAPNFVGLLYAIFAGAAGTLPFFASAYAQVSRWNATTILGQVSIVIGASLILGGAMASVHSGSGAPTLSWIAWILAVLFGSCLIPAGVGLLQRREWARILTLVLGGTSALSLIGLPYFCAVYLILLRHETITEFDSPRQ